MTNQEKWNAEKKRLQDALTQRNMIVDVHLRAFEEAKAFVASFLGWKMPKTSRHEAPIMNFVIGLADELKRERERTKALKDALRECSAEWSHFQNPHTIKPGTRHTLHGPVEIAGGPCMCRWCKARRLVDAEEK